MRQRLAFCVTVLFSSCRRTDSIRGDSCAWRQLVIKYIVLAHLSVATSSLCLLAWIPKLILISILCPSLQILGPQVVIEEYQRRQTNQWEGTQKEEGPEGIVARYGR